MVEAIWARLNPPRLELGQSIVQSKPTLVKPLSTTQRYGLAVLLVALALIGALLTKPFGVRDVEVPLFLFALTLSAWYGGVGPAAVALLLSCLTFDYFFVEPVHSLYIDASDLPYFAVFTVFASLVTWFSTVRHRVEAELRQTRDDLEVQVIERTQQASLLNLTHDTIFVRDFTNATIAYWNRGAQELYGWTPEQAIGQQAHELLRTVFPAPLAEIREELQRAGRWEGELEKTRADGTKVVVASRWSLRRDAQGQPLAILETNNDITEHKQREQEIRTLNEELERRTAELENINKELEAFAYSVSHDLRAPLRHMVGFTELLQKNIRPLMDERSHRYMRMILESGQKMGTLIDDLLAFSRIGRAEAHKTMFSLDQLVQEALSEVRQEIEGRNIALKVGALPEWYGDRSMLRLVLVNLVANAVKFTSTRPRAEIEIGCAEQRNDRVVVFVRDNGVGFDMKYVNKLFGVFQRLHPTESFEGTGIGLATVQRIVNRHGGRAWAEGRLDGGATFYFSLAKSKGA